jgi:hypothetical protein
MSQGTVGVSVKAIGHWVSVLEGSGQIVASMGDSTRIWFYRDQNGREIGFILEKAGRLSCIEAKWSEHPVQDDTRMIEAVEASLSLSKGPWRPGRHAVVCRTVASYRMARRIQAIGPEGIPELIAGPIGA